MLSGRAGWDCESAQPKRAEGRKAKKHETWGGSSRGRPLPVRTKSAKGGGRNPLTGRLFQGGGQGMSKIAAHRHLMLFFRGQGMSDMRAGRHTRQWLRRANTPTKRRELIDELRSI